MFKVTKQQLCKKLLLQKKEGVRLFIYLGPRYFISKAILIAMTVFLFLQDDSFFYSIALIGSGYLIGMILAHLRSFIILKNSWPIHQELIDWHKVEDEFQKS